METDRQQLLGKEKLQLLHLGCGDTVVGEGVHGLLSSWMQRPLSVPSSQALHSCQVTEQETRETPISCLWANTHPRITVAFCLAFGANRPSSAEAWGPGRISESPP